MAYSFGMQIMGRSPKAGLRSAVAAAAYRAGQKLGCERSGLTHDYTKKTDVAHSEILVPEGAPDWMLDRAALWNAVEAAEKRRDAQLAREVRLSIPHQLDHAERVALVRDWVQTELVSRGMVADVALHSPHDGGKNAHAHAMLTTRRIDAEKGAFGPKAREWNDKQLLIELRESWAVAANAAAEKAGHAIGWTHLSNQAQVELAQAAGDHFTATAKAYAPTVHEGPKVQAVRKKLQVEAEDRGITLHQYCSQLIETGESTGALELIAYNEERRMERAAQLELAQLQAQLTEAKQKQARVVYAAQRFDERRAAREAEEEARKAAQLAEAEEMAGLLVQEQGQHFADLQDLLADQMATTERDEALAAYTAQQPDEWPEATEDHEEAAMAAAPDLPTTTEALPAQERPALAIVDKQGASLWEKQEEPPAAAVTLEAAAAHLDQARELQEASKTAREELEALLDRKRRHDAQDAGAAAFDGMAWQERAAHEIMTVARDLLCLIPGVQRLIGPSKHTRLLQDHARAGQAMAKDMARLQGRAAAAEQRLDDLRHRPEAGLAQKLGSVRASWQRGHRKHCAVLWDAAASLDATAARTKRSDLREDWKAEAVKETRALARDLRDAQRMERPSDAQLMESGGRFDAPAEHAELLELAQEQEDHMRELPALEKAAAAQDYAQRADQSHKQRPSSGPRMG